MTQNYFSKPRVGKLLLGVIFTISAVIALIVITKTASATTPIEITSINLEGDKLTATANQPTFWQWFASDSDKCDEEVLDEVVLSTEVIEKRRTTTRSTGGYVATSQDRELIFYVDGKSYTLSELNAANNNIFTHLCVAANGTIDNGDDSFTVVEDNVVYKSLNVDGTNTASSTNSNVASTATSTTPIEITSINLTGDKLTVAADQLATWSYYASDADQCDKESFDRSLYNNEGIATSRMTPTGGTGVEASVKLNTDVSFYIKAEDKAFTLSELNTVHSNVLTYLCVRATGIKEDSEGIKRQDSSNRAYEVLKVASTSKQESSSSASTKTTTTNAGKLPDAGPLDNPLTITLLAVAISTSIACGLIWYNIRKKGQHLS